MLGLVGWVIPRGTPIERMTLTSHQVLDGGAVWLRYKLENEGARR